MSPSPSGLEPSGEKVNVVTTVLVVVMVLFAPSLALKSSLFLMWTAMSALLAVLQGLYVVYQLVMILVSLVMLSTLLAIRRAYSMLQVATRATPRWQRLLRSLSKAESWRDYVDVAGQTDVDDWVANDADLPCAALLRRAVHDLRSQRPSAIPSLKEEKDDDDQDSDDSDDHEGGGEAGRTIKKATSGGEQKKKSDFYPESFDDDEEDALESLRFTLSGLTKRNHLGIEALRWYPPSAPTRTKRLIDDYLEEVRLSLKAVATCERVPTEEKAAFFSRLKRTVGVTALSLSGGGSITMYHAGHLLGLIEADLYDQIKVVSGTSGGSIMAAMVGCKTKEEMVADVLVPWVSTDYTRDGEQAKRHLRFFPPLFRQMVNFARTRVLVDSLKFKETCDFYWGDVTFQEAHEKTGKVLCISVSAQRADGQADSVQRLLMNHITTPHVTLASAVAASCALPGILRPQRLEAKDRHGVVKPFEVDGVSWIDGSIQADVPFKRMATLFNVSNFIVCQVNFHVRLVVEDSSSLAAIESTAGPEGCGSTSTTTRDSSSSSSSSLTLTTRRRPQGSLSSSASSFPFLSSFFRGGTPNFHNAYRRLVGAAELSMRMRATMLSQLGLMPSLYGNSLRKVFSQKYVGDVTIAPRFTYMQSIGISAIIQPNVDDMKHYLLGGKRAVYPHANRIRHMLLLETTLGECLALARTERRKAALNGFLSSQHLSADADYHISLSDDEGVFADAALADAALASKAASMPALCGGGAGQTKRRSSSLVHVAHHRRPNDAQKTEATQNKQVVDATHYRQLEWEYRRLQTRFERLRSENLDLRRRLEDIRSMCASSDPPDTSTS
mmetsp:Transcript_37641/g.120743  ORF Transcript_37641/g.120743 Transcript_37641/m.120743 type:complete len:839 (-) Transcript_37641:460-2976(-)